MSEIPIYCPKCKTRVLYWNGITKMKMTTQCKSCKKYLSFDPEAIRAKIVNNKPERETSSGARFW